MIKFEAKKTEIINEIISDKEKLKNIGNIIGYPFNIVIPEEVNNNIKAFEDVFSKYNVAHKIFYAHKCNKSSAIIKNCLKFGINVEVSSASELKHVLANGYTGEKILSNGPKNKEYIWISIEHNTFISVDSYYELQEIDKISKEIDKKVNLLLRINNASSDMIKKESKFGLDDKELKQSLNYISDNSNLSLIGIAMHFDTISIKEKVDGIKKCIRITSKLLELGFDIRILDIGGGYKINYIEDGKEYQESITKIKENILSEEEELTWNDFNFGMRRENGTLRGTFNSYDYYDEIVKEKYLDAILNSTIDNRSIADIINDFGLELWIEPGRSLLDNVGLIISKVNFIKEVNNKTLVGLEMKNNNLLMGNLEMLVDPIVLNESEIKDAFMVSNLCLENDFIFKRKVYVNNPNIDDLVVFVNTAPYFMDFDRTNNISNELDKKIVVRKGENGLEYYSDETYNPFIN